MQSPTLDKGYDSGLKNYWEVVDKRSKHYLIDHRQETEKILHQNNETKATSNGFCNGSEGKQLQKFMVASISEGICNVKLNS